MSRAFFAVSESRAVGPRPFRSRFEPCVKLSDGEIDFPITRVDPLFEDLPMSRASLTSPTAWMVMTLRRIAQSARQYDVMVRPLHVPAPMTLLMADDAPRHLKVASEAEGCCPQEFVLEFQDACLAATENGALDRMEDFRRQGFRIGIDARRSSGTPFGARVRTAVERMRVSAEELLINEAIQQRAEIVSSLGGAVILDRAHWKQADLLVSYGATHALKMIADA